MITMENLKVTALQETPYYQTDRQYKTSKYRSCSQSTKLQLMRPHVGERCDVIRIGSERSLYVRFGKEGKYKATKASGMSSTAVQKVLQYLDMGALEQYKMLRIYLEPIHTVDEDFNTPLWQVVGILHAPID